MRESNSIHIEADRRGKRVPGTLDIGWRLITLPRGWPWLRWLAVAWRRSSGDSMSVWRRVNTCRAREGREKLDGRADRWERKEKGRKVRTRLERGMKE